MLQKCTLPNNLELDVTHHCKELDLEQLLAFGPGLRVCIVSVCSVGVTGTPTQPVAHCVSHWRCFLPKHAVMQSTYWRSYCMLCTAHLSLHALARQQSKAAAAAAAAVQVLATHMCWRNLQIMSTILVWFLHVQFDWKLKGELFVIDDFSHMLSRYSKMGLNRVEGLKHKTLPSLAELQQSHPEQVPEDCGALLPKLKFITFHPMRENSKKVAAAMSTAMSTGEVRVHWTCRGNCCQCGLVRFAIDLQATNMPATLLWLLSLFHHVVSQV